MADPVALDYAPANARRRRRRIVHTSILVVLLLTAVAVKQWGWPFAKNYYATWIAWRHFRDFTDSRSRVTQELVFQLDSTRLWAPSELPDPLANDYVALGYPLTVFGAL